MLSIHRFEVVIVTDGYNPEEIHATLAQTLNEYIEGCNNIHIDLVPIASENFPECTKPMCVAKRWNSEDERFNEDDAKMDEWFNKVAELTHRIIKEKHPSWEPNCPWQNWKDHL